MANPEENPGSSSEQLRVQGRRRALLIPWLPPLIMVNLATFTFVGILSNTVTAGVAWAWWLWLLILFGSVISLGWRLRGPFYLQVGPDGIEYRCNELRAAYKWSEISSFTIAAKSHLLSHRPAVCLHLANGLGPEVLFAQRLSRSDSTPPFRETSTGWIVLCYLNQFTLPAVDIDATITHFAGSGKRVDR